MARFQIDWVLIDELAIGPAPRAERHVLRLHEAGVKAVLSLCSKEEASPPPSIEEHFACSRLVLPDHRSGRLPETTELLEALKIEGLQLDPYRTKSNTIVSTSKSLDAFRRVIKNQLN